MSINRVVLRIVIALGAALVAVSQAVLGQAPPVALPAHDWAKDMPMKITEPFTLASVGDLLIMRPVGVFKDPGFQAALKLIRDADVSMGNFESNIHDMRSFEGPVTIFNGTKEVAADIKAMGFDIVGRANNHALDGDLEGMFETNDLLQAAGIVTAGAGRDLDEAREARFIQTKKGRVGLVAMHTPTEANAGFSNVIATRRVGGVGGRPGLSTLGLTPAVNVTAEQLAELKSIRDAIYQRRSEYSWPVPEPADPANEVLLFGSRYRVGSKPGMNTFTMNRGDLDGILEAVKNGKQYGHFMMATIHTHQNDSNLQRSNFGDYPPDFLVTLAHATIDNGADAFIGHGPHVLRGVEIYKGKPVFYGLGEFFHDLYWRWMPFTERPGMTQAEAAVRHWETFGGYGLQHPVNLQAVVAISQYDKGQLQEVRLYPTDGRPGDVVADVGRPRLAAPELAKTILERLQKLSAPFGTKIAIEGSVGVIRVPLATTQSAEGGSSLR